MPGFRGRVRCISALFLFNERVGRCTRCNIDTSRDAATRCSYRTAAPSPVVACWIMLFGRVANRVGESVMANLSGQIDALEQRLKQLKIKQQRMESRRRSIETRRGRRDDLRRKILVGAVVLAKVEEGRLQQATLDEWLNAALTRADDRALFGLTPPEA